MSIVLSNCLNGQYTGFLYICMEIPDSSMLYNCEIGKYEYNEHMLFIKCISMMFLEYYDKTGLV